MKRKSFKPKGSYFLLLLAAVIIPLAASSAVYARPPAARALSGDDSPAERIVPAQRGLAKLAPDLRQAFERWEAQNTGMPRLAAGGEAVLVSALIQPGTDARPFFLRSAVGRPVAGVQ